MRTRNREAENLSAAPLSSIDSGSRYRRGIVLRDDYLDSLWAFAHVAPTKRLLADEPETFVLQTSYAAGFQYHMGEALWIRLAIGDALQLFREPENPHDRQAVRIEWRSHKLGYVPRVQNHAIAQLLDRDEKLAAKIVKLKKDVSPWQRIEFAIEMHERQEKAK